MKIRILLCIQLLGVNKNDYAKTSVNCLKIDDQGRKGQSFNFIALGTVGTKVERPVVFIDWYS